MLKSSTPINSMRTPGRPPTSTKKRKSSEGDENHSPNLTREAESETKKSRFNLFKSPTIQKLMDPNSAAKSKPLSKQTSSSATSGIPKKASGLSGLPRYSRSTRSSTATTSAAPAKPPKPTPKKQDAVASSPRPTDSSVRSPVTANRRLSRAGGRPSLGVARIRTRRASIGGKIRTYFDQSAFDEARFNEILSAKPKSKRWDYKEKAKKQEELIVELKTMLKQMIEEHKGLKEKCLTAESNISDSYKELDQQKQNLLQDVDSLRANEAKYRKDYFQAAAALSSATTSLQHVQEENAACKSKIEALEATEARSSEKLGAAEETRHTLEAELARATGELELTKSWLQESTSNMNSQVEQRVEQAVQTYRDQVASLTAQLELSKTNLEAKLAERGEADRVAQDVRESLLNTQAELRETTHNNTRMCQEIEKIQSELSYSRAQAEKKEVQLSQQTQMYHDLQKSSIEEKMELNNEISRLKDRLSSVEQEKVQASADLSIKDNQMNAALKELEQLRSTLDHTQSVLEAKEQELNETRYAAIELSVAKKELEKAEQKLEVTQHELVCTSAQLKATEAESVTQVKQYEEKLRSEQEKLMEFKESSMAQINELQEKQRQQADLATTYESQVKELKSSLVDVAKNAESALELGRVSAEAENLRRRIAELINERRIHDNSSAGRITELEAEIKRGEVMRRKMHNTIQELRGNVRVFARVRPFLPSDNVADVTPEQTIQVRDNLSIRIMKDATESARGENHNFMFDKAFGPHTSQEIIFEEVSEFVQSALDGYNVCLFSYGQTGSGKVLDLFYSLNIL